MLNVYSIIPNAVQQLLSLIMYLWRQSFILIFYLLVSLFEIVIIDAFRGHVLRHRHRARLHLPTNTMVVVQQKSLNETFSTVMTSEQITNLSYDDIYSEWSKWSKCKRRCKQVRTRICKYNEFCMSTVLKEEKSCSGDRCVAQTQSNTDIAPISADQDVPQRGRGRSSQFRVLYHLQSYVYSQWSEWSSCTKSCRTRRYRGCEMKDVCGNSIIQEDAICYIQGSNCEKLYKRKRKNSLDPVMTDNDSELSETKTDTIDDINCGMPTINNDIASNLRIIGGRESTRGRWPWMVAILNRHHEPFCGGTLVTSQFVVTAAHCVRRRLYIKAGEHDLISIDGTEQHIRVTDIFVHPDYDAETVDNDIALLRLRTPLKTNEYVSPVCLPSVDDVMPVNSLGTILGWGKRKNSAVFGTDVLHQANVPIADTNDCKRVYENYFISQNMVCAGYKRGKVDSCAGDSGGPLLFSKKENSPNSEIKEKWYIYGITSFGEGCGRKGKYGIYAKVPNLVKWIRKTIQRNISL